MTVDVIGAGLSGCEAAWTLANLGHDVKLHDIKPKKFSPAHEDENFCELVCSNSLKSADVYGNACGLLKEEMRILGSLTMEAAKETFVPAGAALAVDRKLFAGFVTEKIKSHPKIETVCEEVEKIPDGFSVIATGPLTQGALAGDIEERTGKALNFYDATAPVVSYDSIDMGKAFTQDRYGKGDGDYINCPMGKDEYYAFVDELLMAKRAVLHEFEKREIFEGCMPIEVMAERGPDTLRFGPLKPVGLRAPDGTRSYAAVQLRRESAEGDMYGIVGFQTNLTFPEQKRVFSMIPALSRAEYLRYGVMHRNSFLNSPKCLEKDFSLKGDGRVFFAGQITGVEGYVESAAAGILAGINLDRKMRGKDVLLPPPETMTGALAKFVTTPNKDFEPMNANYGILKKDGVDIRDKKERYKFLSSRALEEMRKFWDKIKSEV
ncbi:MAG: methylenetetrahydrofolate--tRNA-(uracil(54)-C(5))-methyltransferase (FADH(2)-oxidizing) TrmFO [Clostridia bacterium]|nr:methylenetetrahydrofolate--tRNA-(uracil(54)-C(5))-methyltransferase (FADH(2)-oxidizing) TrmFO [Clostridia bacterium]